MPAKAADKGELSLAAEPKPISGPPLRGGKPRKRPYYPRPSRKKSPPELVRSIERAVYFTPAYAEYVDGKAASMGVDHQVLMDLAIKALASLMRWESPPPLDPKKVPEGPWLEGLEPAKR